MAYWKKLSTWSIQTRLSLTVVVGLLSLAVTHYLVDLFHKTYTYSEIESRLQDHAKRYAQMLVVNEKGELDWSEPLPPDPRFNQPRSGLYAVIYEGDQLIWASPSASSLTIFPKPPSADRSPAGWFEPADMSSPLGSFDRFKMPVLLNQNSSDEMSQNPPPPRIVNIMIYEDGTLSAVRVETFSYAVWGAMWSSLVLILLAQSIAARWSVQPLKNLAKEVKKIQSGVQPYVEKSYPEELIGVADSLNDLIDHEARQKTNYKNSLGNLAHSLKTPLAVIRSLAETCDFEHKKELMSQVEKMDQTISYQLSVASRAGRSSFAKPVLVEPIAQGLAVSLEKIHAAKGALCEFEIDDGIELKMDPGDIQELIGNLLENAFKWCRRRVLLSVQQKEGCVRLCVEDDGQGVPSDQINAILSRGVRADERQPGHGIGLAIVKDIVQIYDAQLIIGSSKELGGACFEIIIKSINS